MSLSSPRTVDRRGWGTAWNSPTEKSRLGRCPAKPRRARARGVPQPLLDLDAARLRRLRFRQVDLEQAVVIGGLHLIGLDLGRQPERSVEPAARKLVAQE